MPKPSKEAQMEEQGAGRVLLSDVATKGKRPSFLNREVRVWAASRSAAARACVNTSPKKPAGGRAA